VGLVKTPSLRRSDQPRSAADELPIEALSHDGLLIRSDGALVRYLSVVPNNPLVLDEDGCQRMTAGLTDMLLRVPAGMSLQFYVQANHISLEQLVAEMRAETDGATQGLIDSDDELHRAQGAALRALAACHEQGIAQHAETQAALRVRYVLVVSFDPAQQTRTLGALPIQRKTRETDPLKRTLDRHLGLMRDSQELCDQLRASLRSLDLTVEAMSGQQVADLLWSRLAPTKARALPDQAPGLSETAILGSLDHDVDRATAAAAASRLRGALAQGVIDFRPFRHIAIDGDLEQTGYLSKRPERTFYGWLLHAMQSDRPWTLSMHVRMRDRGHERDRFRRRERVLWGINSSETGRPNRSQHEQEAEVTAIGDELASGGESIADVSLYLSLRELGPEPDARALGEASLRALRTMATPVEAGVQQGECQQPDLWRSSLPLGLDVAARTFPLITRNVADSIPFVSTSSGSPDGIPFAFADPGRTVERINPFDKLHDNAVTLGYAKSGKGKTATVIHLASAAMARGAQVSVIDRSTGHYKFLCSLIPGAAHLELGDSDEQATINCWDVADPGNVPKDKVAFLLHLHALLIGEHDPDQDSYGLDRLQRSLLAHAIRATYRRCHRDGLQPREQLLHQVLGELADLEADRAAEHAAIYRDLALGVAEFCGDGTYAYLFDRPTSLGVRPDAPLVVFNTTKIPGDIAPAVLFSIFEYITNRNEDRWAAELQRRAAGHRPAGPLDGTSMLVFEEVWKVVSRRATAEFVAERARRGRHTGLWTIALSQTRTDMDNPNARALLDNATMHFILGQSRGDLKAVQRGVGLGDEEIEQIRKLTTEKGVMAQAYFVNGERGRGTVAIRMAAPIYWTATSEPHHDVPRRGLALRTAGGDPWGALALLVDPAWHAQVDRDQA
jgi:hypothetical protein